VAQDVRRVAPGAPGVDHGDRAPAPAHDTLGLVPIWITAPVARQPQLTLVRWSVAELLSSGDRHLVGFAVENREGRVSTAVQTFDADRMVALTLSGRVYKLEGHQGVDIDGLYVWTSVFNSDSDEYRWLTPSELGIVSSGL
jgi:hypothetical protein